MKKEISIKKIKKQYSIILILLFLVFFILYNTAIYKNSGGDTLDGELKTTSIFRDETNPVYKQFFGDLKGGFFGSSLTVGDFNGDSKPDLAVGQPAYMTDLFAIDNEKIFIFDSNGNILSSIANNFDGGPRIDNSFGNSLDTVEKYDGNKDFLLVGAPGDRTSSANPEFFIVLDYSGSESNHPFSKQISYEKRLGWMVASADLNGDGIQDFIVTAPMNNFKGNPNHHGEVFIHDGNTGQLMQKIKGKKNDNFGSSVVIRDIFNDENPEIVIGATKAGHPNGEGYVKVFSNKGEELLTINGPKGAFFGSSISLPDKDCDNKADYIVVGAPFDKSENSLWRTGSISVFNLDGSLAWKDYGYGLNDAFGWALETGDIDPTDSSCSEEIIIGSPQNLQKGLSGYVKIVKIDGSFVTNFVPQIDNVKVGEAYGFSLTKPIDLDNDGFKEIAIGAPFFSDANLYSGYVEIRSFKTPTRELPVSNPIYGKLVREIPGETEPIVSFTGYELGDSNGDGKEDFFIEITRTEGTAQTPKVTSSIKVLDGISLEKIYQTDYLPVLDSSGMPFSIGDVNGDKIDDLIIMRYTSDSTINDRLEIFLSPGGAIYTSINSIAEESFKKTLSVGENKIVVLGNINKDNKKTYLKIFDISDPKSPLILDEIRYTDDFIPKEFNAAYLGDTLTFLIAGHCKINDINFGREFHVHKYYDREVYPYTGCVRIYKGFAFSLVREIRPELSEEDILHGHNRFDFGKDPKFGDFNGDGTFDLIIKDGPEEFFPYLTDPTNIYIYNGIDLSLWYNLNIPGRVVTIGDVNNDGYADIINKYGGTRTQAPFSPKFEPTIDPIEWNDEILVWSGSNNFNNILFKVPSISWPQEWNPTFKNDFSVKLTNDLDNNGLRELVLFYYGGDLPSALKDNFVNDLITFYEPISVQVTTQSTTSSNQAQESIQSTTNQESTPTTPPTTTQEPVISSVPSISESSGGVGGGGSSSGGGDGFGGGYSQQNIKNSEPQEARPTTPSITTQETQEALFPNLEETTTEPNFFMSLIKKFVEFISNLFKKLKY